MYRESGEAVHGLSETVVGVLGGGQLGRMLCQAASQMAIKVVILDPLENCPANTLADYHTVGSYNDSATVEEFSKRLDILMYFYFVCEGSIPWYSGELDGLTFCYQGKRGI